MSTENIATSSSVASLFPNSLLADLLTGLSQTLPPVETFNALQSADVSVTFGSEDDNTFYFVPQTAPNSVFLAGSGYDTIFVGEGNNFIVAANTTIRSTLEPFRVDRDYIELGAGTDTVVLGDTLSSYYALDGWRDYAYIEGFDVSADRLVLFGDRTLYQLETTEQGSWLLLGDNSETAIAYLNGITQLSLDSEALIYTDSVTETASPEPEEPELEAPIKDAEFYQQLGIPQYEDIVGSLANDQLIGGEGSQQLIGFGGTDYAAGGSGADLFILGDFGGSYYARQGWQDSVYIEDFTAGVDQLQLQGTADRYSTTTDGEGSWLYDSGDAIAYLKNVTAVDLSSFKYLSL